MYIEEKCFGYVILSARCEERRENVSLEKEWNAKGQVEALQWLEEKHEDFILK